MKDTRRLAALMMMCIFFAACRTPSGTPAASVSVAPPSAAQSGPTDMARFHVLIINGGGRPAQNYQSNLLHVREMLALLLQAGTRPEQISILNSDGSDPAGDMATRETQPDDFWLVRGTKLGPTLRPRIIFANSEVPDARLQPATRAGVEAWFESARQRLRPGDTLLLYVTDHGTKDPEGKGDSRITLWGEKETLSVSELRGLLARLDPGVRVVSLMSQCYSGGFADLLWTPATGEQPQGNVCGYVSSTADRPAFGCYPESRGPDNIGHSFDFLRALRDDPRFASAHAAVLVADRTPDVPLTTGNAYLASVLRRRAEGAGQPFTAYVDTLLREAWRDTTKWEADIRLLDSIGQSFGIFSPRSLAEVEEQLTRVPQVEEQFKSYTNAWKGALADLSEANLGRFLKSHPGWAERLTPSAMSAISFAAQQALAADLLSELGAWTRADAKTHARLTTLNEKSEAAAAPTYRMEVRLAVLLRMRAILTDLAGRVYMTTRATPAERAAYTALRDCENLTLGTGAPLPGGSALAERPSFPRFEDDLRIVEQIIPAWMGIRFRPVPPGRRTELRLADGATSVQTVYPDSPAAAGGFQPGDIVIGPPGTPFTEPQQIREWTMLSKIDEPAPLEVLRGSDHIQLTLVPKAMPQKWPALPGPPKVGSAAPPVTLAAFRGTPPAALADGKQKLFVFWATWCGPSKASIPEVMAYGAATNTSVIAITDEPAELLAPFFKESRPFPETVAIDEVRRAFVAYGVSGTPTFVLVDGEGIVRSYSTGYRQATGLNIDGWVWRDRPSR